MFNIALILSFCIHIMMIGIAAETESKRKTLVFYPLLVLNMIRSWVQAHILEISMYLKPVACLLFCENFYLYFIVLKMKRYSNSDLLNIALVLAVMIVADFNLINSPKKNMPHTL